MWPEFYIHRKGTTDLQHLYNFHSYEQRRIHDF